MGILNAPRMRAAYVWFIDIHRRHAKYFAKVATRRVSRCTYIVPDGSPACTI
jgi:hypothetical protein